MLQKIGAMVVLGVVALPFGAAALPAMAEEGGDMCKPSNRQECYEECAYWHGRDIEKCNRLKDPKKRPACYDKANQTHAACRRKCEKDFPE